MRKIVLPGNGLVLLVTALFVNRAVAFPSSSHKFPYNTFQYYSQTSRRGMDLQAVNRHRVVDETSPSPQHVLDRRKTVTTTLSILALASTLMTTQPVMAFDRTFPDELTETDRSTVTMGSRLNSQQRATAAAAVAQSNQAKLNLLYDPKDEKWLQDRNDGLFAAPPTEFLFILSFVFASLGVMTQFLLLQLAEGDSDVCLQLAGVSLIGGATLELGRIASGEKGETREEADRSNQLREEFAEFAQNRLVEGGNCHRRDIVSAFRRYFAKYRRSDNEEYALTDLEIEQLLRSWNRIENRGRAEMTSSGFYYGVQINKDADAFV